MEYTDFVKDTMLKYKDSTFESLKKMLVGEYLTFEIIKEEDVTKEVLAEKVCGYFEKMNLKSSKSFNRQIETYIKDIDSIVESRIEKAPQPKKNDPTPVVVCRARKYYEKAADTINSRNLSTRDLLNYSRIMFCLYTEIIKNQYREITSLNYSANCLNPDNIIGSMKNERDKIVGKIKKARFEIKNLYSADTCTFIITMIVLHSIIDEIVEGEYYHE